MKNLLFSTVGILLLAFIFSCKNKPKAPQLTIVGTLTLVKNGGTDCDKPDTLRVNCVEIKLKWPNVEQGSDSLKQSVAAWAHDFLVGILGFETDADSAVAMSLDAAADGFIETQKEFSMDAEGSPMGNWVSESWDTVLLNDGKHLTLEIGSYTFAGGAHGSPLATVATFDTGTGRQLTWTDLVTDTTAMKTLAEKKYLEVRADLFKPTDGSEPFEFDDIFKFELPQNYGLVKEGIYCHYLHYEVGPYVFGDTQFVIPFAEMGALSKIK